MKRKKERVCAEKGALWTLATGKSALFGNCITEYNN